MKGKISLLILPLVLFLLVWLFALILPASRFSAQAFAFPGVGYFNAVNAGKIQEGSQIYGRLGCVECHTQHISGREIWKNGWFGHEQDKKNPVKERITLPDDYSGDYTAHLGYRGFNPDLSNLRDSLDNRLVLEGEKGEMIRFGTAEQWLYLHLYNPRDPVFKQKNSSCPAMPWLFVRKPVRGQGADPLALPVAMEKGMQLVPREEARILVSYLLSLSKNTPMPMDMVSARRSLLPHSLKSFYLPRGEEKVLSEKEIFQKEGSRVFSSHCSVCHGHDGSGDGFNYPPLADSEFLNLLADDLIDIVLRGIRGPLLVKGKQWDNFMTPLGDRLSDREIAAVLVYATGQFSKGKKEEFTESSVKRRREAMKGLPPIPAGDLMKKMSKNE